MIEITHRFPTLAKAEQFQNQLYEKYEYVRLIDWPRFDEAGYYKWNVKQDKSRCGCGVVVLTTMTIV